MTESGDDRGIVLGAKLAENLDVEMGDKVVYTLMDREGEIVASMARVSGIVETGAPSMDAAIALLPIGRGPRGAGLRTRRGHPGGGVPR